MTVGVFIRRLLRELRRKLCGMGKGVKKHGHRQLLLWRTGRPAATAIRVSVLSFSSKMKTHSSHNSYPRHGEECRVVVCLLQCWPKRFKNLSNWSLDEAGQSALANSSEPCRFWAFHHLTQHTRTSPQSHTTIHASFPRSIRKSGLLHICHMVCSKLPLRTCVLPGVTASSWSSRSLSYLTYGYMHDQDKIFKVKFDYLHSSNIPPLHLRGLPTLK